MRKLKFLASILRLYRKLGHFKLLIRTIFCSGGFQLPKIKVRSRVLYRLIGSFILFVFLMQFFSFPVAAADNKFGLNIVAQSGTVRDAAGFVKQDGWIVFMPYQSQNYDSGNIQAIVNEVEGNYFSQLGMRVKYVIRGHYPNAEHFPDKDIDSGWADRWSTFWAQTLARIEEKIPRTADGSQWAEVYFIPWNEPNLPRECNNIGTVENTDCAPYVTKYINSLRSKFEFSRIKLLSPAMGISAPNFESFVNALGGSFFLNSFDGMAFDYYDFESCGSAFCNPNPFLNPAKFEEVLNKWGVSKPAFMVEVGVVAPGQCGPDVPDCPDFTQPIITNMLCELNKRHGSNPRLAMFAPLTYDPETKPGGVNQGPWFWQTPQTRKFYEERGTDCAKYDFAGPITFPLQPEVIQPESSPFCTDFVIGYSQTSETRIPLTPTPTGTVRGITSNVEEITGTLRLEAENLPDFSRADKNFLLSLERLLPADLKNGFLIDQTPLKTKTSHYVIGKDSTGKETAAEKIPETEISFPSWWTSLIGGSKVLCGLFNTCQPPKSLAIKVQQPNLTPPSQNTLCLAGNQPKTDPVLDINTLQEEFKTKSLWQRITEIIDDIINRIRRTITKRETELANKTRGYLTGGETFNQQSSFLDNFLPAGVIPVDKNAPLAGEASYKIVVEGKEVPGGNQLNYQNLGKARARYCLQLCSLYPAGVNITAIDPLCPSCNLKDYPLESFEESFEDVSLDMSLCQKEAGACDYCLPLGQNGIGPSCTGDPICEGGKCCPMQFRQAKDYTSHGCPVPYGASDCNDPSVCRKMTFAENPDGGFGACQYQNQNVCVRTDREEVNSCAAVCNWACCSY